MSGNHALTLYVRNHCWFCGRVLRAVDRLGLDVEVRNIWQSGTAAQELLQATGRQTVPVLRIRGDGGESRWLPESGEIIRYLETAAGGN